MSKFDFVIDAKLAQATYTSNNQSDTPVIDGWSPVVVDLGTARMSATFGAQLYEKDGQYKVAFRGTEGNLKDWLENLNYAVAQWSPEFGDTAVFMAKAIVQIAEDKRISVTEAIKFLTTTGHSQGGFQSELGSLLFGAKGTSLDGMGATGVVNQFRSDFTAIMQREGVGELAVQRNLGDDEFGTRIYTVVGRTGVHAGSTDGAWSWSLSKMVGVITPPLALTAVAVGLYAHKIADIVANEEVRASNFWWRLIGDASDPTSTPAQMAFDISDKWAQVQVGGPGAPVSADAVQAIVGDFLSGRDGQTMAVQEHNKTVRITSNDGDVLTLFSDGSGVKTVGQGNATVQTEYVRGAQVRAVSSYQIDDDGNTLISRSGQGFASTYTLDPTGQIFKADYKAFDATNQLQSETFFSRSFDGTTTSLTYNNIGQLQSTANIQTYDDGNSLSNITYANGRTELLSTDDTGTPSSLQVTTPQTDGSVLEQRYAFENGKPVLQSSASIDYFYDDAGVSRIETITTSSGTVRNTYDTDNNLYSSETLPPSTVANLTNGQAATVFSDLNGLISAIKSGQPLPLLASGLRLLNDLNANSPLPNLNAASQVAAGALSFYNLYNALNSDNDFAKINATLSTINYANIALNVGVDGTFAVGSNAASLNSALNGSVGGAIGVLPALGLISSIQNGDPIGMAMSIGTLINPLFLTTPLGWFLAGAAILKAIFSDDGPPDAWGVANVSFGPGVTNYGTQVNATGENFGPDRVRGQLQNTIDALTGLIQQHNAASADSSEWLGIIPQRLPSLNFRASEFADKGYAVTDINALSGAQRYANLRFDDSGQVFGLDPASVTPELRAMLGVQGAGGYPQLNAYMLNSALARQAIAPMWEVQTAKMQGTAGDPNSGLTEEERAAKAGLGAAVDTAYANSHTNDVNANSKRMGHFMPIGIDLDTLTGNTAGVGRVSTVSIAQIDAANKPVSFDWDGTGYQKQTGWIGANDGFLVLDRNFNNSVDNGVELLSNPLVADPAKGLRSLAAFDANGDGRIDALDPVYAQLKVWQDLDQDGNNTHSLQLGPFTEVAQDETGGVKELRSLADWGITAIDYSNSRYEFASVSGNNGVGYGSISTQTLEAQDEGVLYTPVGAGIRIDATNQQPEIVITQVLSEAAVYDQYVLETAGETIGVPGAELYEDGTPGAYNPSAQGGPITITISAAQLLGNDTWHGAAGSAAGLVISGVGNASHLGSAALTAEGNISLTLQANFNGAAGFDYTVMSPDGQTRTSRVGLTITPVNDVPTVDVATDPGRPVYGYSKLNYSYTVSSGSYDEGYAGSTVYAGSTQGAPIYAPYVEEIIGAPIYQTQVSGSGDAGFDYVTVLVGYEPSTYVQRLVPIDMESPDAGTVAGSDPDSAGAFSYEVVANPLYGKAVVDAATGRWSYTGQRPSDIQVADVTGDGVADWVDLDTGTMTANSPRANVESNRYGGAETRFFDYFTVRVRDSSGRFTDQQIQATHYGPAPFPIVAGSGGKKPIAIDLDGNGFQFTDVNDSNVFMDVNGDGWKRRMAWVKPGDGLIAFDKDGNGKIESVDEIAFVGYAPGQQTDLAALRAAFDTNGNGVLDAGDAKWSQFGVWQDANSNGVQEAGEYRSLTDMGITALGLTSDGQFQVIDGQTVHGVAVATKADGSTLAVADVTLRTSNEAQVPTANPDGTFGSSTVVVSKYGQGQAFDGTAGKDLVFGTAASDAFRTGDCDDVIMDDGGNDIVEAGAGNDLIYTGIDNDIVNAGAGNDTVFAGAGNDVVFGDGANETGDDVLMLEDGNDVAFGGNGNDFISGGAGNDVLSGNDGRDQLFGEGGWDALFGQEGDDELWGMDGDDLLDGGAGNDLLSGGAGIDAMAGGAGDDIYEVDSAADTVTEVVDGVDAGGTDTVRASIDYTLADALEKLTLIDSADLNGTGNAQDNVLVGNAGRNTLMGLAGNDMLDGGIGADTLLGGAGDDTYVVDNADDVVIEAAAAGTDTVRSRVSFTLSDNVENLTLVGINAINGTGNALANTLIGNTAANVLTGGAGDDTYYVDNAGDIVVEAANEGLDTVITSVDQVLADHAENLTLTGAALVGTGNEADNVLRGNNQNNVLDGAAGVDQMLGGAGDDIYIVDNTADQVMELAAQGVDTVLSQATFTLSDNVEVLTLTGAGDIDGFGNSLNNTLTGNAGRNLLDGAAGADAMAGGAGDDTYVVDAAGDTVTEWFNGGIDTVLAAIDYVLPENVENLLLTGSAMSGLGNSLDNQITGNAQDNLLDGGGGADTLGGADGNDTYVVDDTGDTVIEAAAQGNDTVLASASYALSAFVENLTLTGSQAINAMGNELDNVITGNSASNNLSGGAGADTLSGGAGADTLSGGAGDDFYGVDNAADTVNELAGGGVDSVTASVSYSLSSEVENLTLTGEAETATGNALNNMLTGNDRVNLLDGGMGADTMAGGAGSDTYIVDDALDTVVELEGNGTDTVLASVSTTLSANVENLIFTGSAAINATGNALDNTLTGNAGNNALNGGAGNDTYVYNLGGGLDIFTDASGTDTLRFGPGLTLDTVALRVATVNGQKAAQIRVLDATGNELPTQGIDYVMAVDAQGRLVSPLENFVFADGSSYAWSDLLIQSTSLIGTDFADLLIGGRNDDYIFGSNGRDVLYGGSGNDRMLGDNDNDLLYAGGGNDSLYGGNGDDQLYGEAGNDLLDGDNGNDVLVDTLGNNRFYAGNGNDTVIAGAGNDLIDTDNGRDQVYAGDGNNTITTGNDDDYVVAGTGVDAINTDNGRDVVQSGAGADMLLTGNDNDLVDAGAGNDTLSTGSGADWIAAGKGDDIIDAGQDRNIFAFNLGDGADTINNSWWGNDTVSLGQGIRYADMTLAKTGNDLVLDMGSVDGVSDRMTLKNWYTNSQNRGIGRLQVVTVGGDYDAASSDVTRNKQVELFDFAKLVQKFDAARAANASQASGWSVMNGLLDAHLSGSDTQALGGDLSFQYAAAGSLSGIGLMAAQSSLAAGTGLQTLKTRSQLEQDTVRLA